MSLPHREKRLERLSIIKLMLLTLPWVGIMSIWTTEFGIMTPLLEEYGLPQSLSSLTWIFGPLTGFFTAPVVGAFSDRCISKYGRRRPFIIGGLILTIAASAVLSLSYTMGAAKIYVAVIAFIVLDITINVMQTPMRAFNSDLVPNSQQSVISLLATLFQGAGGVLGLSLMKFMWVGTDPSQMPRLIGTVMAINAMLISVTCAVIKETPITKQEAADRGEDSKVNVTSTFIDIFKSLPTMDHRMGMVCAIQFVSWVALFSWWPTASTWFARNLFGGCSRTDKGCTPEGIRRYEEGTALYSESGVFAYVLQTAFSMVLALAMQYGMLKRVRLTYALCLAVGGVFMILAKFGPQTPTFAYVIAVAMAIPISAINSFPFAIVGRIHAEQAQSDVGRDFGTLNIFICLPQFIITFVISGMREGLGNEGLPWALVIGGIMFGFGTILALFMRETHLSLPGRCEDILTEEPYSRAVKA